MHQETEPLRLADAVCEVLSQLGPEVLLDAESFRASLLDCADVDSPEVRMFRRNLDATILEPLSVLARGGEVRDSRKLAEASSRMTYLLTNERFVSEEMASSAVYQLMDGVSQGLGVVTPVEDPDATGEIPLDQIFAANELDDVVDAGEQGAGTDDIEVPEDKRGDISGDAADGASNGLQNSAEDGYHDGVDNALINNRDVGDAVHRDYEDATIAPSTPYSAEVSDHLSHADVTPVPVGSDSVEGESRRSDLATVPASDSGSTDTPSTHASHQRSGSSTSEVSSKRRFSPKTLAAAIAAALVIGGFVVMSLRVSLSFDGNGATNGSTKSVSAFRDHEVELPESGFEMDGYSFVGWSKTPDGEVSYQPGDSLSLGEETTLYAHWLPHVSFEGNGADSGEVEAMLVPDSGTLVLPQNGYERAGYQYAGWSLSTDGSDVLQPETEATITKPTTYYAAWQPIASFAGNGAEEGATEDVAASVQGDLTLPKNAFKRSGYRFGGWSLTEDGADRMASGDETTITEPTTFYATWKACAIFAANGAKGGKTSAVAENDKGLVKMPECGFERQDCAFIGWYQGGEEFAKDPFYLVEDLVQPGDTVDIKGVPTKFYACWKFDDATLQKVHAEKVERSGKNGKTLLLIIRNDSPYEMELNGQMRYVSADGKQLNAADIFSPVVSPGETVLQACDGEGEGSFDYTLLARPSRFGTKSAPHRLETKEVSVSTGKLVVEVTNKSKETVHLLNVQAYATQSGMETTGGFAYCGGEGFEEELAPGATTTVTFGSDDWDAPWPDLKRNYYFDGYAT